MLNLLQSKSGEELKLIFFSFQSFRLPRNPWAWRMNLFHRSPLKPVHPHPFLRRRVNQNPLPTIRLRYFVRWTLRNSSIRRRLVTSICRLLRSLLRWPSIFRASSTSDLWPEFSASPSIKQRRLHNNNNNNENINHISNNNNNDNSPTKLLHRTSAYLRLLSSTFRIWTKIKFQFQKLPRQVNKQTNCLWKFFTMCCVARNFIYYFSNHSFSYKFLTY